jgi:acetolactate synthase II small subunit
MTHTVRVRLKRQEGSLLRTLGVVFRRGFEVVELSARVEPEGRWIDMTMRVESDRPIEPLCRQIEKLFDVVSVQRVAPEPAAEPAPVAVRSV